MLRALSARRFEPPTSAYNPGAVPSFHWLETSVLVVDDTYQREIGKRGAANVRLIAENFEWSKFAPVIVAAVEGGRFAIVDGQHRTTAAMLRGIKEVPCQIIVADRKEQAAAFAAVNGSVTKTTAQQVFHARLTSSDKYTVEIQKVCEAAGICIVRTNLLQSKLKVGETMAIGAITRCVGKFGRDTVISALQCITQTSDGNAGFARASIIEGLCIALKELPLWRESGERLLRVMDSFSFPDAWSEVTEGRDQIFPSTVRQRFAEMVTSHLAKQRTPRIAA